MISAVLPSSSCRPSWVARQVGDRHLLSRVGAPAVRNPVEGGDASGRCDRDEDVRACVLGHCGAIGGWPPTFAYLSAYAYLLVPQKTEPDPKTLRRARARRVECLWSCGHRDPSCKPMVDRMAASAAVRHRTAGAVARLRDAVVASEAHDCACLPSVRHLNRGRHARRSQAGPPGATPSTRALCRVHVFTATHPAPRFLSTHLRALSSWQPVLAGRGVRRHTEGCAVGNPTPPGSFGMLPASASIAMPPGVGAVVARRATCGARGGVGFRSFVLRRSASLQLACSDSSDLHVEEVGGWGAAGRVRHGRRQGPVWRASTWLLTAARLCVTFQGAEVTAHRPAAPDCLVVGAARMVLAGDAWRTDMAEARVTTGWPPSDSQPSSYVYLPIVCAPGVLPRSRPPGARRAGDPRGHLRPCHPRVLRGRLDHAGVHRVPRPRHRRPGGVEPIRELHSVGLALRTLVAHRLAGPRFRGSCPRGAPRHRVAPRDAHRRRAAGGRVSSPRGPLVHPGVRVLRDVDRVCLHLRRGPAGPRSLGVAPCPRAAGNRGGEPIGGMSEAAEGSVERAWSAMGRRNQTASTATTGVGAPCVVTAIVRWAQGHPSGRGAALAGSFCTAGGGFARRRGCETWFRVTRAMGCGARPSARSFSGGSSWPP